MKKHALGIGILASGLMLVALIIAQNVNAVFFEPPDALAGRGNLASYSFTNCRRTLDQG